jgi:hypothetical protein
MKGNLDMRQNRHIWRHCQRKQDLQSDEKIRFSFCRSDHRTIHYQKNEELKMKKLLLTASMICSIFILAGCGSDGSHGELTPGPLQ